LATAGGPAMPGGGTVPGGHSAAEASAAAQVFASPAAKNAALLNVLKEELFAVESEKLSGKITLDEYNEIKPALETVLKRALNKN
jgi:hypothetical protein